MSSETRLRLWLLTINDAPLRCGFCDEIIIGSGTGPVHVLLEAIERHVAQCEHGIRLREQLMAHACKICILAKGITIRDTFETEDELFDHLEREHHFVVPREGETQEDADRRVLASGLACDECTTAITARLQA